MPRDLNEWLSYIESLHTNDILLGLDGVKTIANRLKINSFDATVITVAGTNGKGSCIAVIEALALTQGMRVATYTSPHLQTFNERLKINGQPVSDGQLCEAFQIIDTIRDDVPLTYFEFTTLAIFWLIKQQDLDVIILEIGLGGRLDAVNIIDNQLAIITSIDYDHMDWLGDTLEEIAAEKAAIVRENADVIIGESNILTYLQPNLPKVSNLILADNVSLLPDWWPDILEDVDFDSIHPVSMAAGYLAAKWLNIPCESLKLFHQSMSCVNLNGRWQSLANVDDTWVDVAHNPQAVNSLIQKMTRQTHVQKWYAVCGMLKDKNSVASLSQIAEYVDAWYFVPTQGKRGQTANELTHQLQCLHLPDINICETSVHAIRLADSKRQLMYSRQTNTQTLQEKIGIIVFGTFEVVASSLSHFANESLVNEILMDKVDNL